MFGRDKKPAPLAKPSDAQIRYLALIQSIKKAYRQAPNGPVNLQRFLTLIDVFEALYQDRATDEVGDNYLNAFVGTGIIEGRVADILGTVPEAIQRQRLYTTNKGQVDASQAAVHIDALIKCLDRERFNSPVETTLAPFTTTLQQMANGQI